VIRPRPVRVFIVGRGRVGRSLARALRSVGVDVVGLRRRGGSWRALSRASVVVIAVRDRELAAALAEVAAAPLLPGTVVLHTSGGVDATASVTPLRRAGHPAGTFHPLVPLADPVAAADRLRGAWIGIEGDPRAVRVARSLARALGAHMLPIPDAARAAYHAAAVIASNFPVVLAAVAQDVMQRSGVPRTVARRAVHELQRAAIENLADAEPARALTGPVARGDAAVVAEHAAALANDPLVADAYRVLSRLALRLVTTSRRSGSSGRRP
jgi:predicted short-subunit dehydrogenase-like oxidoreductase (DUF2520 family)